MGGAGFATGPWVGTARRVELPGVLVVVAVQAQQLPVAAVGRIVVVVVVLVVHRELAQARAGELAPAASADPGVELERPLAVAGLALGSGAPSLGERALQGGLIDRAARRRHRRSSGSWDRFARCYR